MARPKKKPEPVDPKHGYTAEQGENGNWLVRLNGRPTRTFPSERDAKKYVDYMVARGK